MSILDAVEPDCWRKNESVQWDSRIHTTITHKSEFPEKVARLFNSPLYSRETVESLLSQCRKEARKEAQDAVHHALGVVFENDVDICAITRLAAYNELRRMAEGEN